MFEASALHNMVGSQLGLILIAWRSGNPELMRHSRYLLYIGPNLVDGAAEEITV